MPRSILGSNPPVDGFDMAKLQKPKSYQRTASGRRVSKLSPAEIRELNEAVTAHKNARSTLLQNPETSYVNPQHQASPGTPPLGSDNLILPIQHAPVSQQLHGHLPTPPHSPDVEKPEPLFTHRSQVEPQAQYYQLVSQQHVAQPNLARSNQYSSARANQSTGTYLLPEEARREPMPREPVQQVVRTPSSNFSRPRQSAFQEWKNQRAVAEQQTSRPPGVQSRQQPGQQASVSKQTAGNQQHPWPLSSSQRGHSAVAQELPAPVSVVNESEQHAPVQATQSYVGPSVPVPRTIATQPPPTSGQRVQRFTRPLQDATTTEPSRGRQTIDVNGHQIRKKRSSSAPLVLRNQSPSIANTPLRVVDDADSKRESYSQYTALPQARQEKTKQEQTIPETSFQRLGDITHRKSEDQRRQKLTRKSFHDGALAQRELGIPKPERRKTFSGNHSSGTYLLSIHYNDTVPGQPPQMRESLKEVLPSKQTGRTRGNENVKTLENEFGQHPAVRPNSPEIERQNSRSRGRTSMEASRPPKKEVNATNAGKSYAEEQESKKDEPIPFPTYTRCSCCGKLRKPAGVNTSLSPVLENEHLRANFSFELGRKSLDANRNQEGSPITATRPRHVPIIPMEIGNQTRQATIAPFSPPLQNSVAPAKGAPPVMRAERGVPTTDEKEYGRSHTPARSVTPARSSTPSFSRPLPQAARGREEPRIVRFSSLHERQKEVEQRGRERQQRSYPEEEQMQRVERFDEDDTIPDTAAYPSIPDRTVNDAHMNGIHESHMVNGNPDMNHGHYMSPTDDSPQSSPAESDIDLVDQMPRPPSAHVKTTITPPLLNIPSTRHENLREPDSFLEDDSPVVDINPTEMGEANGDFKAQQSYIESVEKWRPRASVDTVGTVDTVETVVPYAPSTNIHHDIIEQDEVAKPYPLPEPKYSLYSQTRSSSDEALPLPPPTPSGKPTTIVRIIHPPSIPIPQKSPKRPGVSSPTGPPRIGDWILPTPVVHKSQTDKLSEISQQQSAKKAEAAAWHPQLYNFATAESSRENTASAFVFDSSANSSTSYFQVGEATVSQVVTHGSGRVKELGRDIAKRMREAQRRVGVTY